MSRSWANDSSVSQFSPVPIVMRASFLVLDRLIDASFQGSSADELAHLDVVALADPECRVGGLVLDRGIPPAVDVDDMVGSGEVHPGASGLERQQEDRRAILQAHRRHLLRLAEAFDDDQFLIFTWRGRTKEDLPSDLRALRETPGTVPPEDTDVEGSSGDPDRHPRSLTEPALADRITDFWRPSGEFPACPAPPADLVPDLLLRQMDPVPLQVDGREIVDLLRPTYDTITTRHR
jgi:hypothetical protein